MTKAVPLISQCFVALLLNSFNFKEFVSLGTVSSNHDFYLLWWYSVLSASAYFSQVWWRINSLNMLTWKQQLEVRMSSSSPSLPHSKISRSFRFYTVINFSQIPSQNRNLYESSFINSPVHSTTFTKEKQRQPLKRYWNIGGKKYPFPWNCTWTPNKITFVLYICVSAEDGWSSLLEKFHSKIPELIFFFSFLPWPFPTLLF